MTCLFAGQVSLVDSGYYVARCSSAQLARADSHAQAHRQAVARDIPWSGSSASTGVPVRTQRSARVACSRQFSFLLRAGGPPTALADEQPGQVAKQFRGDVEHGTTGITRSPWAGDALWQGRFSRGCLASSWHHRCPLTGKWSRPIWLRACSVLARMRRYEAVAAVIIWHDSSHDRNISSLVLP